MPTAWSKNAHRPPAFRAKHRRSGAIVCGSIALALAASTLSTTTAVATSASTPSDQGAYRIEWLPAPGAETSRATAISADGKRVGGTITRERRGGDITSAAIWTGRSPRILAPLGGDVARVESIDEDGRAAGYTTSQSGVELALPAITRSGRWSPLPLLPDTAGGTAESISGGVTVGWMTDADENFSLPFIHAPGGNTRSLGSFGGSSGQALDINSDGMAAGWSQTADEGFRSLGFITQPGGSLDDAERIEGLGGSTTFVRAINEWGAVVGDGATSTGVSKAFVRLPEGEATAIAGPWSDARYTLARDVNDRLQVVGDGPTSASNDTQKAWYWDPQQGHVALDSLVRLPAGWSVAYANAISADGSIAGEVRTSRGEFKAAVLRPRAIAASNDRIAFVSERDGDDDLYLTTVGGSPSDQLTNNTTVDRAPQWSPNGRALTFNSRRAPHSTIPQIYVINTGSGRTTRISTSTQDDARASWAPDGRSLLFQRGSFSTGFSLWQAKLSGGWERRLTTPPTTAPVIDAAADSNPRTGEVVFQTNRGSAGIFPFRLALLNPTTRAVSNLPVALTSSIDGPRWSPDGRQIVFASGGDLYVLTRATGNLTQVTAGEEGDLSPDWSPDGRSLVFQSDRVIEDGGIHTIDLATKQVKFIGEGRTPVWAAAARR